MKCSIKAECGACNYIDEDYEKELKDKKNYLAKLFKKINYNKDIELIKNDNIYHYRNKAQMAFKQSKTKRIVNGFYQEKTKSIVTTTNCEVHAKEINIVLNNINLALDKCKIEPVGTKRGIVNFCIVKYGFTTKQIMVVITTKEELFPSRNNFVKELLKLSPNITTIIQNINPRDTTIVLGPKERVLHGSGYIIDELMGLKFKISARSFYQINPKQTEVLYSEAIKMANLKQNEYVVDSYSGIGTIGLIASKQAARVLCVENNKDAVKDAIGNAKLNKITNVDFVCEDSTKFLINLKNLNNKPDCLIMDPPRSGSTYHFIKAVSDLKIKKVVYISCDPETLVRDLEIFIKLGYDINSVKAVDMFSRTKHVETVVGLRLK